MATTQSRQLEIFNRRYEKILQNARFRNTAEPGIVYRSVLILRRSGYRVYRDGAQHHNIDDERVDHAELIYRANLERMRQKSEACRDR